MTDLEAIQLLVKMKELGITQEAIDQLKAKAEEEKIEKQMTEAEQQAVIKAFEKDDAYTDEEILYWATPYFDELQDKKNKQQHKKDLQ